MARPRYATRRRPDRPTRGTQLVNLARVLGVPLMPWQELVAEVAGEYDRVTGIPYYPEVGVTVPRQSGKTTLILVWMLHRALMWGGESQRIAYTAQTGQDARKKLVDDYLPLIKRSKMANSIEQTWRAAADTGILFKGGSKILMRRWPMRTFAGSRR